MGPETVLQIVAGVIAGAPRIIDALRRGQNWKDLTLDEIIPDDVREKLDAAQERADDYVVNG